MIFWRNNEMKKGIVSIITIGLLSACGMGVSSNGASLGLGLGSGFGRHIGVGTSINIPLTFNKNEPQTASQTGVNIIEQKIITYFDTQGQPIDSAVKGGFYRQLVEKQGSKFLVQDFYGTGEKRTDPMLLDRSNVFEFRAIPKDGKHTIYAINGAIMSQYTYQNGQVINNKSLSDRTLKD